MQRFRVIEPGDLRLPPSRQYGPDPVKYQRQVRRFGSSLHGMPPIEVTEGMDEQLMISNGVTRATRAFRLAAGQSVPVEVIDFRPKANLSRLKRVRDLPP